MGRLLSATTPEAVNEPKQLSPPDAVSPLRVTSLCSAANAGRMQLGTYQEVPVLSGDTVDTLASRVQERERKFIVEVLQAIVEGCLRLPTP